MATDNKRCLIVTDKAGLPVGHVPRGLAGAFTDLLDLKAVITAFPTGLAVPSFPPWPVPSDVGDGAVVPCEYTIDHPNRSMTLRLITAAVHAMPERYAVTVV